MLISVPSLLFFPPSTTAISGCNSPALVSASEKSLTNRSFSALFPPFHPHLPCKGRSGAFFAWANSAAKRPRVAICRDLSAESVFWASSPRLRERVRVRAGSFLAACHFGSRAWPRIWPASHDAPRPRDIRPLGRIAERRRKSSAYHSLHLITRWSPCDHPQEGCGAHFPRATAGRLSILVCKHWYTTDSNYRANSEESVRRASGFTASLADEARKSPCPVPNHVLHFVGRYEYAPTICNHEKANDAGQG